MELIKVAMMGCGAVDELYYSPAKFAERFNNLALEDKNLNLEAVQF